MIYSITKTINAPRARVVELFDNPDNMSKWQPELISFDHFEGELGKPGAKSRLKYQMGKREVEMIETIELRELPDRFDGIYEAKGVWNRVRNTFVDKGETTEWIIETEFRMKGFMKLMEWFMPGAFKKQTAKFMDRFIEFVHKSG